MGNGDLSLGNRLGVKYHFGEWGFKFGKLIGVGIYIWGMGNKVCEIDLGWGILLRNGNLSLGNRLGLGYTFGEWGFKFGKSIGVGEDIWIKGI